MKLIALCGALVSVLFLGGCLQGREYARPEIDLPASWANVAPSTQGSATEEPPPTAAWWTLFRNEELTGLIEQALADNHDVKRAVARLTEGRAGVMAAAAGLYPQVNVGAGYTNLGVSENTLAGLGLATNRQPSAQVFATPGTTINLWNSAVDLRWELDMWGRVRRGQEAATAEAQALIHDARGIALSLISDVGHAYFRIRELDEQIEIAQRTLAMREERLEIIAKRASVGLASDLDVTRTDVLVAEAAGLLPDLGRMRALEVHRLEVLTGMSPGTLAIPARPLRAVVIQPQIPVGLPSQLLERRPDILQAESVLVASNARIGQARAFFFPSLAITGQGGLQSTEFVTWFARDSWNYSIGPSITLPIFQGGNNVARLDSAESRYQQMLEQYRQVILVALREVADLLTSLSARAEQLSLQRDQLRAAQAALALSDVRYQKGLVSYLDVLDAQRTALAAETQVVATERARLHDMVELFKALGGGWEVPDQEARDRPSLTSSPNSATKTGG